VETAKPNPEIYYCILEMFKIDSSEAIFVDDAVENIQAANDIGIHGIQFLDPDQAKRDVNVLLEKYG
jgi:2-haloacid dehalogenase